MFRPKSLRQRQMLFLIAPIAVLLLGIGLAGFCYARALLFAQWREATILKLQTSAHQVDMRLGDVETWLLIYKEAVEERYPALLQHQILEKLKTVQRVDLLPYHDSAMGKYNRMNLPFCNLSSPAEAAGRGLDVADRLASYGLTVQIGG